MGDMELQWLEGRSCNGVGMQKAGRAAGEGEPKVPLWGAESSEPSQAQCLLKWISRDKEEQRCFLLRAQVLVPEVRSEFLVLSLPFMILLFIPEDFIFWRIECCPSIHAILFI